MTTRLATANPSEATGPVVDYFTAIKKSAGKVPNLYVTVGSLSPDSLGVVLNIEGALAKSSLPKIDIEVVKLAVSEASGCDYCLAAHTLMGKAAGLTLHDIHNVRAGAATGDAKRDALVHFVHTLVKTSGTLPASEVEALQAAGYSDRQLIEIALAVASITFTNLVNRMNDTTLDFPAAK